jgi:uncharacterized lipoprotein YehR (DUF1307 family)
MKKTLRIVAVAMVAVMLCLSLASCGKKLSGTYEDELGISEYTFKGNKVEISIEIFGAKTTIEGTYSIKDDEITFEFDDDEEDAKEFSGTFDFEEGDDYIKIGEIGKLEKKK